MRAALVVLALALVPALASADHVYSHRFVFEGRLVGGDGLPLPGRLVQFYSTGETFVRPCGASASTPVTDDWGDFRFCFHAHDLKTSTRTGVRVGNLTVVKPMDTGFRRTIVLMQEPNETGVAPEGWATTYRVAGKAWQPGPTLLEQVHVFGLAVTDLPVNLTVETASGTRTLQTVTDGFGDFDLRVELAPEDDPEAAVVTIEAMGRTLPVQLDPVTHRTTAPVYVEAAKTGDIVASFPQSVQTARVASPGDTPPLSMGLVSAVALALVAAIGYAQRRR